MISANLIRIFLVLSAIMTLGFAYLFAFDPQAGLDFTTHRESHLIEVMAGRYLGLSLFALGIAIWGDLKMMLLFFVVGAVLALIDGYIYWSDGLAHWKHTSVGILSVAAAALTFWVKSNGSAA